MAEELETLVLKIRADTQGLAADSARIKSLMTDDAAAIGRAFDSLFRTGKLGLGEWQALIRALLNDLMQLGQQGGFSARGGGFAGGGSGGGGGFWGALLAGAIQAFSASGRATGGPVTQGRPYMVGERGPEIFVPERAGRIETLAGNSAAAARVVNIAVNVTMPEGASAQMMQRSGAQVARAVRRALEGA